MGARWYHKELKKVRNKKQKKKTKTIKTTKQKKVSLKSLKLPKIINSLRHGPGRPKKAFSRKVLNKRLTYIQFDFNGLLFEVPYINYKIYIQAA